MGQNLKTTMLDLEAIIDASAVLTFRQIAISQSAHK